MSEYQKENEMLQSKFYSANIQYFLGKLECKVSFKPRPTTRNLGTYYPETNEIKLNPILLEDEDELINCLLHEMCHAEVQRVFGGHHKHDKVWQREACRVSNLSGQKITTTRDSEKLNAIMKEFASKQREERKAEVAKPTCYSKRKLAPVERKIWSLVTAMYKDIDLPRGAKSRCLDELYHNPQKYPRINPRLVQQVMKETILPRFK